METGSPQRWAIGALLCLLVIFVGTVVLTENHVWKLTMATLVALAGAHAFRLWMEHLDPPA